MTTLPIAMHMANELLTVPVAGATAVLAFGGVSLAALRCRKSLDGERLPLMGVLGAFVFAAQMINFTLPGLGTSGHLGGAVLLAILLGPSAAIVTMAAILIIQCLLFQDGGLLALGCNIINMGIVPSLLGWVVYRLVAGSFTGNRPWRQYLAIWAACLLGITAGAALVPVEAAGAGVLKVSFADFLAVMLGVHLLIGLVEGLITFAVVAYLIRVRPSACGGAGIFPASRETASSEPALRDGRLDGPKGLGRRAVAVSILLTSLLLAGVVSWFASEHPDGLEWALDRLGQKNGAPAVGELQDGGVARQIDEAQSRMAPMPDYNAHVGNGRVNGWVSLAGIAGTLATLAAVHLLTRLLAKRKTE